MLIPAWSFVLQLRPNHFVRRQAMSLSAKGQKGRGEKSAFMRELDDLIGTSTLSLGGFAAQGPVPPGIAVTCAGVGRLGLPLSREQGATLISKMTQAPFGRGTETVTDVNVRRVWQMDAADVTLDEQWTDVTLPAVVTDACKQIGLDAEQFGVQAHLYKLLCYEEGGHFLKHRDTEKEPGMFGTLIVQVPAEHTGGDLCVEHNGDQLRFSFAASSADDSRYAVFYADCEHTIEPVTSGLRLALAYNLVRTAADVPEPTAASINAATAQLVSALGKWSCEPKAPEKLAYVLHHMYTDANFGFAGLKGKDRQLVEMLRQARAPDGNGGSTPLLEVRMACLEVLGWPHIQAPQPPSLVLQVRLAMLVKEEYGPGPEGNGDSHYDEYLKFDSRDADDQFDDYVDKTIDNEYYEMTDEEEEIYYRRKGHRFEVWGIDEFKGVKRRVYTDHWIGPDGPIKLKLDIDIEKEVMNSSPESVFYKLPSRMKYEGWTGNDGCDLEHWYQTGVVCFWPYGKVLGQAKDP